MKQTLGFFGGGKMASALIKGVVRAGVVQSSQIWACDVVEAARETLKSETQVNVTATNVEVARNSDIAIIAVKPQQVA